MNATASMAAAATGAGGGGGAATSFLNTSSGAAASFLAGSNQFAQQQLLQQQQQQLQQQQLQQQQQQQQLRNRGITQQELQGLCAVVRLVNQIALHNEKARMALCEYQRSSSNGQSSADMTAASLMNSFNTNATLNSG